MTAGAVYGMGNLWRKLAEQWVYLHLLQTLQSHGVSKKSAISFLQVEALFVGDTREKLKSLRLAFCNPHSATPCCAAMR